jgi:hypothetical protein
MRFVLTLGALLVGLSTQALAQQASSNSDAQKAPALHAGTNAQSDVSTPTGANAASNPDATGNLSSDKQRAPSLQAGTNASQSNDPSRDPIQSGTHGAQSGTPASGPAANSK